MGERGPKPSFNDIACPNDECQVYGKTGCENIVGNGTYSTKSGKVRKYICQSCSKNFSDRTKTAFYDLRTNEDTIILALKLVLKGVSLRGIAEILEVKLDTVRNWLQRAAKHCEEINEILLKDLHINKVELDELWTYVQKKQFRNWTAKIQTNAGYG